MVCLETRGSPTRILEDQWPWSIWYSMTSKDGTGRERDRDRDERFWQKRKNPRKGRRPEGTGEKEVRKAEVMRGKRSIGAKDGNGTRREKRERGGADGEAKGRGVKKRMLWGQKNRKEEKKVNEDRMCVIRGDTRSCFSCSLFKELRVWQEKDVLLKKMKQKQGEGKKRRKLYWAKDSRWDLRVNLWWCHHSCCCTKKGNSVFFFFAVTFCTVWRNGISGSHVLHQDFKKASESEC